MKLFLTLDKKGRRVESIISQVKKERNPLKTLPTPLNVSYRPWKRKNRIRRERKRKEEKREIEEEPLFSPSPLQRKIRKLPHFGARWRSRRVVLPARRTDRSKLKCNVHPSSIHPPPHPSIGQSSFLSSSFSSPPACASRPKMPRCSKRGKEPLFPSPSPSPSLRYKCRWFTASGLMEAVYC